MRAKGPADKEVAAFLKESGLVGDDRGVVVRWALGMARRRRALEHASAAFGFDPLPEALVCLYLLERGDAALDELPLDEGHRRGIERGLAAWREAPLAVRASVPDWLLERWAARFPDDVEALALAFLDDPPTTLRANLLKTTPDSLAAALAEEGRPAERTACSPYGVRLTEPKEVFRTAAFAEGLFEMQDEGSQLLAALVDARPGATVVDGCAGAGGKTLALAATMDNRGTLYALDVAAWRLEALKKRARRAGVHNLRLLPLPDSSGTLKRLAGRADAVLVDAPCSGSGVLRRNPDSRWRLHEHQVVRLLDEQRAILDTYAEVVAPGGRLVYGTCSLLEEENEGQVEAFLARHPDFRLVPAAEALARLGISVPGAADTLTLRPDRHGTDGFFAAVLERRGATAAGGGARSDAGGA